MSCIYHLGDSEDIDSIKWYKDGDEFYRIVPLVQNDPVVVFERPGINLDIQHSGVSVLII